jgi:hypothetical protein
MTFSAMTGSGAWPLHGGDLAYAIPPNHCLQGLRGSLVIFGYRLVDRKVFSVLSDKETGFLWQGPGVHCILGKGSRWTR